ncbi:MAG: 50S ribosomal protein L33 [Candidatus Hodgkinia cicadicola]
MKLKKKKTYKKIKLVSKLDSGIFYVYKKSIKLQKKIKLKKYDKIKKNHCEFNEMKI